MWGAVQRYWPDGASRQQLLSRILSSRQFAHAHSLKRILRYLCEQPDGDQAPKEYDIAVQAMGRPVSFDPRNDPVVRVSMGSIRDRLFAYFSTEGKDEPLRLTIPKGEYRAVYTETVPKTPQEAGDQPSANLVKFWLPYFSSTVVNVIVYTEPLFFRDDDGRYIRDWHVNDPWTGLGQLKRRMPGANLVGFAPSYHYLSAGEVHCLLSLTRMFHEFRVPVETRNSRISSWNELCQSNLILLGSPRTNTFLDSMQGADIFVITPDHIENRRPEKGGQPSYCGRRFIDGKLARMTEYALVTRRPSISPGCALTIIAANHGRAIEGAGHFLTLEDRVQSMLQTMKLDTASALPEHFQVLMQVETIDMDDEVSHVECVDHRILESNGPQHAESASE
jgi:hypothetical protein